MQLVAAQLQLVANDKISPVITAVIERGARRLECFSGTARISEQDTAFFEQFADRSTVKVESLATDAEPRIRFLGTQAHAIVMDGTVLRVDDAARKRVGGSERGILVSTNHEQLGFRLPGTCKDHGR